MKQQIKEQWAETSEGDNHRKIKFIDLSKKPNSDLSDYNNFKMNESESSNNMLSPEKENED
jgi:hypothetical protein